MVLLLMGVTGSGKTTIGTLVAGRLGWTFLDADDFHSAANKAKMHNGIPLNDDDRRPWLAAIHEELVRRTAHAENIVLACSALKQWYREILSAGLDMKIVYLKDTFEDLARRAGGGCVAAPGSRRERNSRKARFELSDVRPLRSAFRTRRQRSRRRTT
jgi:gluconokinase